MLNFCKSVVYFNVAYMKMKKIFKTQLKQEIPYGLMREIEYSHRLRTGPSTRT